MHLNILSPSPAPPIPSNQPQQTPTEQLYKQFLAYIKGSEKNNLHPPIQQQYKDIYSELFKSNQVKRRKIWGVEGTRSRGPGGTGGNGGATWGSRTAGSRGRSRSRGKSGNWRGCRFVKIEMGEQAGVEEVKMVDSPSKQNLQDKILIQQQQHKQLKNQISNYKLQISLKAKNISQIKSKIKLLDLQQNKFMEIYHLANNIVQFTDQFEIVNVRNYNQMLEEHEKIVGKLRNVKGKVRGELVEAQFMYQAQQKQHDAKYKKLIKSCIPLQDQQQTQKKCPKINNKNYKKFMQYIEQVLILLQEKQENYQRIKEEQCTKLQNRKFDTNLLTPDRVEWVRNIEQFENKFQIRLESSDKILTKLYKKLKHENQQIQKTIFQYKSLVQDYQQQLKTLTQKLLQSSQYLLQPINEQQQQKQIQKKQSKIRQNSIIFVQVVEVINSLLMKFRYIFKLFITMNIDKRKLSQNLLKLDQVLDKNGFVGCRLRVSQGLGGTGITGVSLGGQQNNIQDINSAQMYEILTQNLQPPDKPLLQQLLTTFFNDMRIALICKKSMILDQIQQSKDKTSLHSMIDILEIIRDECEYSYNQKVKSSFNLLFDCLKASVGMGIKSGHCLGMGLGRRFQGDKENFMSQVYLPAGMFPKVKVVEDDGKDEELCDVIQQTSKWLLKFLLDTAQKSKPEQWGKQQKKNPSKMIRRLLSIRNETSKKFKLLDLHQCQKKYIKVDRKDELFSQAKLNIAKTISSCSKSQENQVVSVKNLNQGMKAKGRTVDNSPTIKSSKKTQINNFII